MEMRVISTKTHGILDYVMGLTLATVPAMLSTQDKYRIAKIIPMVIGGSTIAMSLLTDYELSVSRQLPMRVHLTADLMSGLLLAASPWIFGFRKKTFVLHLIAGLAEVAAALMTKKTSEDRKAVLGEFIQDNIIEKVRGGRKEPRRAVAH